MTEYVLMVPSRGGVGLTTVCLGLVRAFERQGVHVGFIKPIAQTPHTDPECERSTALIRKTTSLRPPEPLPLESVEFALRHKQEGRLLEEIVGRVRTLSDGARLEVVVIEGLVPSGEVPFGDQLNEQIARALDAQVVLVAAGGDRDATEIADELCLTSTGFGAGSVAGCIVNRVERPDPRFASRLDQALAGVGMRRVGVIPRDPRFQAVRVRELVELLDAGIVHPGELDRRVLAVSVTAMTVPNCLGAMRSGTLVVTPGDRTDVIMAAGLAVLGGTALAGLLLTGGLDPDPRVLALIKRALDLGLPVLSVPRSTLDAANALSDLDPELPLDDTERIELVMRTVADGLDRDWIVGMRKSDRPRRVTPPAFRHQLLERSRAAAKRIVLPEGEEPRTIEAALQCEERGIAHCVLLGDRTRIEHVAADRGLELTPSLEIVDPRLLVERYVEPMVERRRHKGLTEAQARNALGDPIVLGTMMMAEGHVDGLVSGAVHTTAHTVRPALQLIGRRPGVRLVSSVFFMCLPEQVLVYGDCAINPDPDAQDLADIALQSARSAQAFGVEPRVALISYSTGTSGSGRNVDKVREATELARALAPEIPIDGPLQYDAAVMPDVAAQKAPGSPVAGHASVLVFPDLNTGNTTYKAVQRSADVVSIGPMLQGLAKPVNDLSRGATVEDIVYTIALTAIQAGASESASASGPA